MFTIKDGKIMDQYSIIEADVESDKDLIIKLLKDAEWNTSYDLNQYNWKYLDPPSGKARSWFIVDTSIDSVIGLTSLFPRAMYLHGKKIDSFTIGDFYIQQKHRCFGPAFHLQKTIFSKILQKQFVYGLSNTLALPILERVGYHHLGMVRQFIKPLHLSNLNENEMVLPDVFQHRMIQKSSDIIFDIISKEKRYKNKELSFELIDNFDSKFDDFFQKILQAHPCINDKSSSHLNWRFIENPTEKYQIFCVKNHHENLVGYIVYSITEKNNIQIYDLVASNDTYEDLIAQFSLWSRDQNIGVLMMFYYGNQTMRDILKKFHFFPLKNNDHHLIISPVNDLPFETYLHDSNQWHFLLGDKF